jgi:signal transduction histidine kinase
MLRAPSVPLRFGGARSQAVLGAALSPWPAWAHGAEPLATGAWLALGLVTLGLGGLAAALAYLLGRQRGRARGPGPGVAPQPLAALRPEGTAPLPLARAAVAGASTGTGAAAISPLLDALPGPALLLEAEGAVWRVAALNAELRRHWPGLRVGLASHDAEPWPAALLKKLPEATRPAAAAAPDPGHDDWRLAAWPSATGTAATLVAWQPAAQAAAAGIEGFGFTLSHDLRAPLRVVEGFTKIVKEDYGAQLDRVGNDHLDRVLGAAARMNLMIDALLNLARLSQQPLSRQRVNLTQLAGYVIDELKRGAPERVVEVRIEPGLSATGDPTLLRLVLENLLGNAWKYTGRAAAPLIEFKQDATAGGDGRAGFVVSDNGAGFDMRSADRLFGLFQRLHSASDFPGHGVGLASVRRIVQRHGGEVWAESEPGRGASFHFTLGG